MCQSLVFQPTVYFHQLNALAILLRISGSTFAAYVDPSVMDRCCDVLKLGCTGNRRLVKVGALILMVEENYECEWTPGGFETTGNRLGRFPPPTLRSANTEATVPASQDSVAASNPTSPGLSGVGEQPRTPILPSSTPYIPSGMRLDSSIFLSPSTSIATLSDLTIVGSLNGELIPEPKFETVAPCHTFYLDDGSVEVICGTALFRVHTSTPSFYSPVLHRKFSQQILPCRVSQWMFTHSFS
jgi:hypothetical protein